MEDGPVVVVGLGNPGDKYRFNRHNVGFLFLEHLAASVDPRGWNGRAKFGGELMDIRLANRRVYLFKPLSFMNRSGGPTARLAEFFHIPPQRVVVCFDDVNLLFGSLRIRGKGSAGGQNGMKDILRCLGTQEVPRLRFGVGVPRPVGDLAGFVLGDFRRADRDELPQHFDHGRAALELLLVDGAEKAASRYNRTVKADADPAKAEGGSRGRR